MVQYNGTPTVPVEPEIHQAAEDKDLDPAEKGDLHVSQVSDA